MSQQQNEDRTKISGRDLKLHIMIVIDKIDELLKDGAIVKIYYHLFLKLTENSTCDTKIYCMQQSMGNRGKRLPKSVSHRLKKKVG